jgi:hypothetical protein
MGSVIGVALLATSLVSPQLPAVPLAPSSSSSAGAAGAVAGAVAATRPTAQQLAYYLTPLDERTGLIELLGEKGAEEYAAKQGWRPLMRSGDKVLRQGIDQLYVSPDGTVVGVEAKGGVSRLKEGYGSKQGTPEWAAKAAESTAMNPRESEVARQANKQALEAMRDGKFKMATLRTPHVYGEPKPTVLEGEIAASGPAEAKAATAALGRLGPAAKAAAPAEAAVAKAATKEATAVAEAVAGSKALAKVGGAAAKGLPAVGVVVEGVRLRPRRRSCGLVS